MNKQQLAARIWRGANQMRSKIEASEYKDYILGFIFYKFLSEQEVDFLKGRGWDDEDVAALSEDDTKDVEFVQHNLGYFISYDNLFSTWLAEGSDFSISDVRDALGAFERLIDPDFAHVYEGIFDTLDTGLSKLGDSAAHQTKAVSGLLALIDPIPMDGREGYDVLGFVYEYLIGKFAANAGKKAGQFYTPHEVAILMSEIIANHLRGFEEIDIYDPTSGSASLLLTIGQSVARRCGNPEAIHYYAQELISGTYNLTRMNLVMRGVRPANITSKNADTLADDWPLVSNSDKPLLVDACVSNPPYSQKWTQPDGSDPRFDGYGLAPKGKADYAFLLHNLYHLRPGGIMTIVLPHGVLFRGGTEGEIRKRLLEEGNIDAVVGLPPNIFFGTGIPTVIMVVKKDRTSRDVLLVDASRGFVKDGKQNRLRARDIRRIVDAYEARKDIDRFAHVASYDEIERNEFNLNIPRYVDSSPDAEPVSLYATMFGGVPTAEIDGLNAYWGALPNLRSSLFDEHNGFGAVNVNDVAATIRRSTDVETWRKEYEDAFEGFESRLSRSLVDNVLKVDANTLHEEIATDVFGRCGSVPLVDGYEAYQILADHWNGIEIDLEAIRLDGLNALRAVDANMVLKKDSDDREVEVQDKKVPWVGRVIPFELIQKHYFADKAEQISALNARSATIDSELEEILSDMDEDELEGSFTDDDNEKWVFPALSASIDEELSAYSDEFEGLVGYVKLINDKDKGDIPAQLDYIKRHGRVGWNALKARRDGTYTKAAVNKRIQALRGTIPVEPDSLAAQLIHASKLKDEQDEVKRSSRRRCAELINATKNRIEALTDDEALDLLRDKWVGTLVRDLRAIPNEVIDGLVGKVEHLRDKYAVTFADVESQIASESTEITDMLGNLTGNDADIAGVSELMKLLGGER
jgi:type I restriction enzyme M protein